MTETTTYRLVSVFRRGLAAALRLDAHQTPQTLEPEPRSSLAIGIKVTGTPDAATLSAKLNGPGDVLGLSPELILRTQPVRDSQRAAWNYLVAVDFALPELPWLFTPGTSSTAGLRPWLVLVVLKADVAGVPELRPGRLLPSIFLTQPDPKNPLPDLSESWAWAHAQAVDASTVTGSPNTPLPESEMVSRLICPLRLASATSYRAYLVPAFNHGVQRGLGKSVAGDLAPAWPASTPSPLELPVYFHWSFRTPETDEDDDFEHLARKLKRADAALGPELVDYVPADFAPRADGCGPIPVVGALCGQPTSPPLGVEWSHCLDQGLLGRINGGPPLHPPIYGGASTLQYRIESSSPGWLRSLNLDLRLRVAAGLGAEVVRANQDTFVQACWTQVGDVLQANALLNRAQLARVLGQRAWDRHFAGRSAARLLTIAAPWLERLRLKDASFARLLRESSLPTQIVDPALRRLLSPQRLMLRKTLRRAGIRKSVDLLGYLNQPVDARVVTVNADGIAGARFLEGTGNPARFGFDATVADLPALKAIAQKASAVAVTPLAIRPTLAATGAILPEHIRESEALAAQRPGLTGAEVLNTWSAANAGAYALLTTDSNERPLAAGLTLRKVVSGSVTAHVIALTLPNGTTREIGRAAGSRQPTLAQIRQGISAAQLKRALWPAATQIPAYRVATGLTRDSAVLAGYVQAFAAYGNSRRAESQPVKWRFVEWPLKDLGAQATRLLDPEQTILERVGSRIRRAGSDWDLKNANQLLVSPGVDRIWATPQIPDALYSYLANYDRQRFLPGVDGISDNQVVGLTTEPAFVQAFLAGANWEMNRELLWRGFPTEVRGTVFTRFWDWPQGKGDIEPIHTWTDDHRLDIGPGGADQLVLLVRGLLIAYHPNTTVMLVPGKVPGFPPVPAPDFDNLEAIKHPILWGRFEPDYLFFGFDITKAEASSHAWYLVFQEQASEPRFGLDKPAAGQNAPTATAWANATWADVKVGPGDHLSPTTTLKNRTEALGTCAAQLAVHLYQKPFRMAFWLPGLLT